MSHIKCECGDTPALALNKDVTFRIGVWCGNCNQKYTFVENCDPTTGQTGIWARYFKCFCDARRYGACTCDPMVIQNEE
ncbi:MAG: hypothetical protein ACTSWU_03350 [Candidatus Thorarchaeota archaeon]